LTETDVKEDIGTILQVYDSFAVLFPSLLDGHSVTLTIPGVDIEFGVDIILYYIGTLYSSKFIKKIM